MQETAEERAARSAMDDGSGDAFVDPRSWAEMIDRVLEKAKDVLPGQFDT